MLLVFDDLAGNEEAVPEPLQGVIDQTRFAVQHAALKNIAREEITERPGPERQAIVDRFFDGPLS